MNRKIIVASTIGLLGITSLVVGAITLADNEDSSGRTGAKMHEGIGGRMMGEGANMMKKFANTGDAIAFRTTVEKAFTDGDYTAFTQAHIKYNITTPITKEQFTIMVTKKANQEKIRTALEAGDYTTWKTLNKDNAILKTIDTEAKFKQLQEMHTYQQKARTIRETLGLQKGEGMGMGKMGNLIDKGIGRGMGRGMNKNTK